MYYEQVCNLLKAEHGKRLSKFRDELDKLNNPEQYIKNRDIEEQRYLSLISEVKIYWSIK